MFLKNSRYHNQALVQTSDSRGRPVPALSLRRLPPVPGEELVVNNSHQLDVMANRNYRDGTRYWHIADANTELYANHLVARAGRVIKVPRG